MARPRKWDDDAARRAAQNELRKIIRANALTHFIGVDGEGQGKWRNHKYVLLGVGNAQIESSDGLNFSEIMTFLWECYLSDQKSAFVGFFLGYDFTQWLKTLPEHRARMLLTAKGRISRQRQIPGKNLLWPVRYNGWEFDMLGSRRFKLRLEGATSWLYINDAGPFFQTSFLSVIDPSKWHEPVCTQAEYDLLSLGKSKRDYATLDEDMRRYNALENDILTRVMTQLEVGYRKAGVKLKKSQWFGPGQAAQKWLDGINAPSKLTLTTPKDVENAARRAYYGGWFEIMAHGHIPGHSYEYDINSAYPDVASRLPCFIHGTWHHNSNNAFPAWKTDEYVLVHAKISGYHPRIGSMLHRTPDSSIRRPYKTAGWFWAHELQASARAGLVNAIDISETWRYEPCSCPPPLRGLSGLYDARMAVGKNTPEGKAYKLVYNSMYGKYAQNVGEPKYNSYLYAGLITSGCRTAILDAIATHPKGANDVLMVATDAVYFRSPHPDLDCSADMGNWEAKARTNLTLFKPGVYWDDDTRQRIRDGRDPSFKSRGVSAKDFAASIGTIDDAFSQWGRQYPAERDPASQRDGWYPRVTFKMGFSMVTAVQALQRGKWFLAGAVSSTEVSQDSDPVTKRHSGTYEDGVYWSRPYEGWWEEESTPYNGEDQPDKEEYGITDDGYVRDHWFKGIHG